MREFTRNENRHGTDDCSGTQGTFGKEVRI